MIEKSIRLACEIHRAFELLTKEAGAWWPTDRRHTKDPDSAIVIEAAGRFYERASDGREVELGTVRVFSPPARLVLDWFPGTGPLRPTHVDIVLTADGEGTLVHLHHREGPFSAAEYARNMAAYEKSWTLVLDAWSRAASDRH